MAVAIRRLGDGDVAALRGLNAVFAVAFEDADTYLAAPPPDAWLARLLAKPDFGAFVAENAGTIVGGLTMYILDKPEQARAEGYIYDLAVAETHRRRGIARALIRAACDWAGANGAWVVFVQADHGDDPAIALYAGLGSREDVLHFDLPVGPPRP
ncbi:MAG: GNAT family N-acetyltransferase [Rhodobacteraceae bacterium]|nr:GNAT family N-acetyltransferase [Paracoccaceae bacterium]